MLNRCVYFKARVITLPSLCISVSTFIHVSTPSRVGCGALKNNYYSAVRYPHLQHRTLAVQLADCQHSLYCLHFSLLFHESKGLQLQERSTLRGNQPNLEKSRMALPMDNLLPQNRKISVSFVSDIGPSVVEPSQTNAIRLDPALKALQQRILRLQVSQVSTHFIKSSKSSKHVHKLLFSFCFFL